jgi:hypothetical protein
MTATAQYTATCRRCRRTVVTAAGIGDAELQRLGDHARRCFPHDAPAAKNADAGEVLRHVDVVEVRRP